MKHRFAFVADWLPALAWMGLIFWLSSIPDLRSGAEPLWDIILRKLAHVAEFAILALLLLRAFRHSRFSSDGRAISGLVIAVLYAAVDEIHQTFVPSRNGAIVDFFIDCFGICLAVLLYWRRHRKSIKT